jgi:hypothetical protein
LDSSGLNVDQNSARVSPAGHVGPLCDLAIVKVLSLSGCVCLGPCPRSVKTILKISTVNRMEGCLMF